MTLRSYKFRFYPTQVQKEQLGQYFGATRWAWNTGLEMMSRAYSEQDQRLSYIDVDKQFTQVKKDPNFDWLKAAPSDAITQKLRDLDRAYRNFFAGRAKYPRFKKRTHAQALRFKFKHYHSGKIKAWCLGSMVLPKVGVVKLRDKKPLPKELPKMVTVSKNAAGQYHVSFMVDQTIKQKPSTGKAVDIDMGITTLATLSDGTKFENPCHLDKLDKRLRFAQRRLSLRVKGSNNWRKQRQRVAKLHQKIRDSRLDHLHKATTHIVTRNDVIAVETLNIKGMVKNHRLARSIHDASMSEFFRLLEYKCQWHGKTLVKIDQWYPSSKTCSCCNHKMDEMNLSVRQWTCPKCGAGHDRDENASTNILNEGLRILGVPEESDQSLVKKRVDPWIGAEQLAASEGLEA